MTTNDNMLPYLVQCEVIGNSDQQRYRGLAAVLMEDTLGLDEKLFAEFAKSGYTFVYSGQCTLITPHLKTHNTEVLSLSQQVNRNKPIAITITGPINTTEEHTATDYLTITENQIPPLPNQDHLPFWEKEWIAPELKELLFGQPEAESENSSNSLRTYLILDAYLYTKIRGFFDLDLIDEIPVKCLFKGKAEEDMKTVAPYLIDMTLSEGAWEDKDKVYDFHKHYFDKQWNQGTGIFVRSVADMEEIYQHFRKFTKVQDENGKWYFFRFWDPRVLLFLFTSYKFNPEEGRQLFLTPDDILLTQDEKNILSLHLKNELVD